MPDHAFGDKKRIATIGVAGGVREDLELQTWLLKLGMRCLTGGPDTGYVLSAAGPR